MEPKGVERGSTDCVQKSDAPRLIRNRLVRTCEVDDGTRRKLVLNAGRRHDAKGIGFVGAALAR